MAYYGGLWGILNGLTKSTDHPSRKFFITGGAKSSKLGPELTEDLLWLLLLTTY